MTKKSFMTLTPRDPGNRVGRRPAGSGGRSNRLEDAFADFADEHEIRLGQPFFEDVRLVGLVVALSVNMSEKGVILSYRILSSIILT